MQSTSWETLDWKKHKLESRLPGEISITSDTQTTPPLWQKVKEESEKVDLKLNIEKTKLILWETDGETVETVPDFIFWGSKIPADGDCSHEIKDAYSLEGKLWPN